MGERTPTMAPAGGLRLTAMTAVKWTSASALVIAVIGFVQVAILARVLEPSAFGLMATTVVIIGVASMVTDLGLNNVIIARQTRDPVVLSTLYWTSVVTGLTVAVAVIACAPLVAGLFDQPELTGLVRFLALGFVVVPLGQQFQILLQRDLHFDVLARIEIVATTFGFAVAVGSAVAGAVAGAGAYALIWGLLGAAVLKSALLALRGWRDWRPQFIWRGAELRGHASFGLFQVGERLTNYLGANVDYLLVAAFLGPEA